MRQLPSLEDEKAHAYIPRYIECSCRPGGGGGIVSFDHGQSGGTAHRGTIHSMTGLRE